MSQSGPISLEAFVNELGTQISLGLDQFGTWFELQKALATEDELRRVAPAFFGFTCQTFLEAAVLTFGKILDRGEKSCSLVRFLEIARNRVDEFQGTAGLEDIEAKLKEDPSSILDPEFGFRFKKPDPAEILENIKEDLARLDVIRDTDAKALKLMRNKIIAHNDRKNITQPGWLPKEATIQVDEVKARFTEMHDMVNKYGRWLNGTVHLASLVGGPSREVSRVVLRIVGNKPAPPSDRANEPGAEGAHL